MSAISQFFWTEFLEIYKSLPCLWNRKHSDYNNKNERDASYQQLVNKLNEIYPDATRETVLRKINSFRSNYNRAYNKVRKSEKRGRKVTVPSLWYYDILSFLKTECDAESDDDEKGSQSQQISLERKKPVMNSESTFWGDDSDDEISMNHESKKIKVEETVCSKTSRIYYSPMNPADQQFWTEFLEIYKSEPCLWKNRTADYSDRKQKDNAYCRLVEKLKEIDPDATRSTVVRKINTFRCSYRRALIKQRNIKEIFGSAYVPTLWYFDFLSFLEDQGEDKESDGFQSHDNSTQQASETVDHDLDANGYGNQEFWTEFLRLYESFPALWDLKSTAYHNRRRKDEAYNKMVLKLREIDPEATRNSVVRKINVFRGGFRRTLLKEREAKKNGIPYKPSLWYYNLLTFLKDSDNRKEERYENTYDSFDTCMIDTVENYLRDYDSLENENDYKAKIERENESEIVQDETVNEEEADKIQTTVSNENDDPFEMVCDLPKKSNKNSDSETIAKGWAIQYDELSKQQQIIARKIISDVLFQGCMGNLSTNTVREVEKVLELKD